MTAQRINLLPPELQHRRRSRQTMALLGAAALALVALLGIVYVAQEVRVRSERNRLEAQKDVNADLQAQVAALNEFGQLEADLQAKTELLGTLTTDEVRWSVILADISLVIPQDAWLTNFTGTVNIGATDQEDTALGTLQLNGDTFTHPDVAKWLTRLDSVDAFTSPYLSLSARAGTLAGFPIVSFSSTVDLSEAAFRRNQRGAGRAP